MAAQEPFIPALLVVDFQEDFCPPNSSLAVPSARSIAPAINTLLTYPFTLKLASRDWHPRDHISFAANHDSETTTTTTTTTTSSPAEPFTSRTKITHPSDPSRSYETTLWPIHCVQDSFGAQLVPELDTSLLDAVIDKGTDPRFEMYSAFHDPFRIVDSGITARLRARDVTHVFVVGLAADHCVGATAESAAKEGFTTYIVEDATKPVYPDKWPASVSQTLASSVELISTDSEELARVKALDQR